MRESENKTGGNWGEEGPFSFSSFFPLPPPFPRSWSRTYIFAYLQGSVICIPTIWEAGTGYLGEVVAYERVIAHGGFDCNNQSENYTDVNQPQGIQEFRQVISGFPCQGKSFRPNSIYEMVKSDLANRSGGYSLKRPCAKETTDDFRLKNKIGWFLSHK